MKDQLTKDLLKELVASPTITNKALSDKLGVSQPTIARHRNRMIDSGFLQIFARVEHGETGTKDFSAKKMYVLVFTQGITRDQVTNAFQVDPDKQYLMNKHVYFASIGEHDGKVALVILLESRVYSDFVDILNGEFIPMFKSRLGEHCLDEVIDITIEHILRLLHNYTSQNGRFDVGDPNTLFVGEKLFEKP